METNSPQQNHAIFLPLPFQGHINPFIQLALKLASRGFTITFLVFEATHQGFTRARNSTQPGSRSGPHDIFEGARTGCDPLDIRYRVVSDGLPLDFDRTRLEEYVEWWLHGGMRSKLEEGIEEVVSESKPRPNLLVGDTYFPWVSKIANKFGLKFASFMTQPALVFNIFHHVHLLREHGHYGCPDPRKDSIDYIPGVKSIDPKDLPSRLQEKDSPTKVPKLFHAAYEDVKSADYILCNTIEEIEPDTILALQALVPFYSIGPIMNIGSTQRIEPTSLWTESSCIEWLDSKPDGSILYVSFGSLVNMTQTDLTEIAYGLMLSNVGFVWALRPRTTLDEGDDMLPPGFEDGVRGRGIIVPWTNQVDVLSHRAVGGFVTHCGWNSILESIWCGTPMLCLPIYFDQPTNRKLVVNDWKVGFNLCDEMPIKRERTAEIIKNFMSSKIQKKLCKSVEEMKKIFENAFNDDGSSKKNLDLFIDKLKN